MRLLGTMIAAGVLTTGTARAEDGPPIALSASLITFQPGALDERLRETDIEAEPAIAGIPLSDERWSDLTFALLTDQTPTLEIGDELLTLWGTEQARTEELIAVLAQPTLVTHDGQHAVFAGGPVDDGPEAPGVRLAFTPHAIDDDAVLVDDLDLVWRIKIAGGGPQEIRASVDGLALSDGQTALIPADSTLDEPAFLMLRAETVRPLEIRDGESPPGLPGQRTRENADD